MLTSDTTFSLSLTCGCLPTEAVLHCWPLKDFPTQPVEFWTSEEFSVLLYSSLNDRSLSFHLVARNSLMLHYTNWTNLDNDLVPQSQLKHFSSNTYCSVCPTLHLQTQSNGNGGKESEPIQAHFNLRCKSGMYFFLPQISFYYLRFRCFNI